MQVCSLLHKGVGFTGLRVPANSLQLICLGAEGGRVCRARGRYRVVGFRV